jgi:hypothetical protein
MVYMIQTRLLIVACDLLAALAVPLPLFVLKADFSLKRVLF